MFATIIFANMCVRDLSRSSLSTRKTRLLTHLPRLWHKMTSNVIAALCVASNLPQATKVRECYDNMVLWYLFTVLTYYRTSPLAIRTSLLAIRTSLLVTNETSPQRNSYPQVIQNHDDSYIATCDSYIVHRYLFTVLTYQSHVTTL